MFITDALNYFSGDYLFQEKSYTSGKALIRDLYECSSFRTLFEEANETRLAGSGSFRVQIEPLDPYISEIYGCTIKINSNLSASEQRKALIRELTEIIQFEESWAVYKIARDGLSTAEEYTKNMELIEYNIKKHEASIIKDLNKENGRFFRSYIENPWENIENMDFDSYYSLLNDKSKEIYLRKWKIITGIYIEERDEKYKKAFSIN